MGRLRKLVTKEKNNTKKVTLDSSVIVSYLLRDDANNIKANEIWQQIAKEKLEIIIPVTVLIEVVAAIKRRTSSTELSKEIGRNLLEIPTFVLVDIK